MDDWYDSLQIIDGGSQAPDPVVPNLLALGRPETPSGFDCRFSVGSGAAHRLSVSRPGIVHHRLF